VDEHELSCRRCALWTETARAFGGTRLGEVERALLLEIGSSERRERTSVGAMPSAKRNALARLRRKLLVYPWSKEQGRGFRIERPEDWGPTPATTEEFIADQQRIRAWGERTHVWLRRLGRTPLGDAVVALYEEQLRDGSVIRWDVEALAAEIGRSCPDRD
jgi:hypothetical protein